MDSFSKIFHSVFEDAWKSEKLGVVFVVLVSGLALFWAIWIPSPGYAVTAMGLVAGAMALRADMTGREKLLWFALLATFMLLELRAIDHDRTQHDLEQAAERGEEHASFQKIAIGIDQAIKDSEQQFDATIARSDRMLGLEAKAVKGLSTNLRTLTGADSFCLLGFVPGQQFLAFYHVGSFPLYGVSARIGQLDENGKIRPGDSLMGITVVVGDMIPGHASIQPIPNGLGTSPEYFNANIFFTGRNGDWVQVLRERKIENKWQRAVQVIGRLTSETKERVLCETIEPGFPKKAGGTVDTDFRAILAQVRHGKG